MTRPVTPRRPALAAELRPAAQAIEARRFGEGRRVAEAYLAGHPGDSQASFLIGLSFAYADSRLEEITAWNAYPPPSSSR